MNDLLNKILNSEQYKENIKWGDPRPGHEEGTIENHINELLENLEYFEKNGIVDKDDELKILIHSHDTFKSASEEKAPILSPNSHASLASAFLMDLGAEKHLRVMVQMHDEPHAICHKPNYENHPRMKQLILLLQQNNCLETFVLFNAIDNVTKSKSAKSFTKFFKYLESNKLITEKVASVIKSFVQFKKGVVL